MPGSQGRLKPIVHMSVREILSNMIAFMVIGAFVSTAITYGVLKDPAPFTLVLGGLMLLVPFTIVGSVWFHCIRELARRKQAGTTQIGSKEP